MRFDRLREIGLMALAGMLIAALVVTSSIAFRASDGRGFALEQASDIPDNEQVLYAGSLSGFLRSAETGIYEFDAGDLGFSGSFFWEDASANYAPGTMMVELHSVRGLLDVCVGSEAVSDNGFVGAYWQGVEAGRYYVKLVRTDGKAKTAASNVMLYWLEHA